MAAEKVEIIGHRGESFLAPENTEAAFNLCWEKQDDAAELDVHLTKDGKLIISHDGDTHRTGNGGPTANNGEKLIIKDHTVEELRKVDVGKWKDPKYAGETMPLLEDVLAKVPDGKRMFIEVKVGPEAVDELVRVIRASGKKPEQLVVISFKPETIREAKKRLPELQMYYLSSIKKDKETGEWKPKVEEMIAICKEINADGLDVQYQEPVNAEFAKKVRDAGLGFYVWTIDDLAVARRMVKLGVDGITTNRAEWLKQELKKNPGKGGA
jgi:glycerophosphoryl diester phosphodiesterase